MLEYVNNANNVSNYLHYLHNFMPVMRVITHIICNTYLNDLNFEYFELNNKTLRVMSGGFKFNTTIM